MLIDVTPGSRQRVREPWTLEKLYHERCLALGSAINTSSLGPYNSALNSYITFCKIHNFPVKPTADTMSYYTVFMSSHIKPDSVSSYLSGICNRLENFFPDVREVRNSPMVSRTLKGCKRLKGSAVNRKSPLSQDNICHAIKKLGQSSDYDDCLFLTILVTGFNGLLHLAELSMPDSKKAHNWRKVVRRTTVEWLPEGYAFFLPAHKADTAFEGNKVIIPSDDDPTFNPLPVFPSILSSQRRSAPCPPCLVGNRSQKCPHAHLVYEKTATNIPRQENRRTIDASRGCYRSHRARHAPVPYTGMWLLVLCRIQDIHSKESCHPSSHDRHSSSSI